MPPKEKGKNPIVVIAVLLVIALLVVGVFVLVKKKQPVKQAQKLDVQKVLNDAQASNLHGKYDEAVYSLSQALNQTNDSQEKYQLLMALGATYNNKQDYKDAEATFAQADAVTGGTYGSALALARAAEANGDKQIALANYKKAADYVHLGKEKDTSDMTDINEAIARLGGQQ